MKLRFSAALCLAIWWLAQLPMKADDYTLETWLPFEGGGVSSAGGMVLEGSFGGSMHWTSEGGEYEFEPGVWVMRAEAWLPKLRVELDAEGPLIRWPKESLGWELEFSNSPDGLAWKRVAPPYQLDEQGYSVRIGTGESSRFYRLRRVGAAGL